MYPGCERAFPPWCNVCSSAHIDAQHHGTATAHFRPSNFSDVKSTSSRSDTCRTRAPAAAYFCVSHPIHLLLLFFHFKTALQSFQTCQFCVRCAHSSRLPSSSSGPSKLQKVKRSVKHWLRLHSLCQGVILQARKWLPSFRSMSVPRRRGSLDGAEFPPAASP